MNVAAHPPAVALRLLDNVVDGNFGCDTSFAPQVHTLSVPHEQRENKIFLPDDRSASDMVWRIISNMNYTVRVCSSNLRGIEAQRVQMECYTLVKG